jgi:hypothetical protein
MHAAAVVLLLGAQEPKELLEEAIRRTRAQESYDVRAKANAKFPNGAFDYAVTGAWMAPGILAVHAVATGNKEEHVVRVGDQTWVHRSITGWVTAAEAGEDGAGRGVQNPDDLLAALASRTDRATRGPDGSLELSFTGKDIEAILKDLSAGGDFDFQKSRLSIRLVLDGESRLKRATLSADLSHAQGPMTYAATVDVTGTSTRREVALTDANGKPIPLNEPIRKAIEELRKKGR